MCKRILLTVLAIVCLTSFTIAFIVSKTFAMVSQLKSEEDTTQSAEILETKQAPINTTESEQMTKDDSLRIEKVEKQMIEEYRKKYLPLVPEHIKFLEQNYRSTYSLELYYRDLERALDLRALPVLTQILSYNPRGINRAGAASTIGVIEKYNKDSEAIPDLVKALDDTITDVQFNVAKSLVSLGDTLHPISVLTNLALGIDKERWSVDWAGYIGLENVTEQELEQVKKRFRNGLQYQAIELLGKLATKDAIIILEVIKKYYREQTVRRHAKEILEKVKPD